eukprot:TRINITY_DN3534_c0_g2_i5.p1 TRINITY_DN3534_c0_g2~~TRINITY_DN3534_c0_g2_i5.p1  ORF type:complete len:198 (-),score=28.92 TRINITY_DN3534_c0_g2_i5:61-654(-)
MNPCQGLVFFSSEQEISYPEDVKKRPHSPVEAYSVSTKESSPILSDDSVDKEDGPLALEIDVRPKRKTFQSKEERLLFVEDYKRKYKTELCKNWTIKGECRYGNKCSFAHGSHELQEKRHLHSNFKKKMCTLYHLEGHCFYGYRCQYIHKEKQFSDPIENKLFRLSNIAYEVYGPKCLRKGHSYTCLLYTSPSPRDS